MSFQTDMFTLSAPEPARDIADETEPTGYALRPYQEEAVTQIEEELLKHRGTLVLMATGLGKTQVACEIIRRHAGRCLFIAHRDELIQQAARRVDEFVGGYPEIEKAQDQARSDGNNHVIASIQTISRPGRLERFDPDGFGLIVVDEVHHATAKSYRKVLDHFASAKILGLTATPDRLDGEALGRVLDSVAYQYEINDAIRDGWLCPIKMRSIHVDSLDFSNVRTVAGDFNQGELDALMALEENLHAVAKPAVECAGERKTLIFTTSVHNAERLAEIVDRYTSEGKACVVSGKTEKELRRETLRKFHRGEHQFFCNVGIATEGYDEPALACVVMGRPTKSRSLYTQMIGRGTRGGPKCAVPGKTDLLVLDFVGNSGKHDIVCTADVLGGKLSDQELEYAKKAVQNADCEMSIEEAIEKAQERARAEADRKLELEEAARKKREGIKAEVRYKVVDPNPYVSLGVRRDYLYSKYGYNEASENMRSGLGKWMKKHAKDLPEDLSQHEARRLLKKFAERAKKGLCSYPQMRVLQKFGYDARGWTFGEASGVMNLLSQNGWRRPPDTAVDAIVHEREPGEEG